MTSYLKRNILLLNILKMIHGASFLVPVITLFYNSRGLDMTEIFILQSIYAGAVILLEVPTGYIGDLFPRKRGLYIGSLGQLLGWLLYFFAPGFWLLAVAELVLALGYTFVSGTDVAMLYDSSVALHGEEETKKTQAHNNARGFLGQGMASMIGGGIALFGLSRPLVLQVATSGISLMLCFFLVEPTRERHALSQAGPRQLIGLVRYALFTHSQLSALLVTSAIISLSTMFRVWLAQPYRQLAGVGLGRFGILRGVGVISAGGFSLIAHKINRYIDDRMFLICAVPVSIFAYLLLGAHIVWWMIPVMMLIYAVRGTKMTILQHMLNKRISSKERATILSTESLFFRVLFMITGPFVGRLYDAYSLHVALIGVATLLFFLWLGSYGLMKRNRLLENV